MEGVEAGMTKGSNSFKRNRKHAPLITSIAGGIVLLTGFLTATLEQGIPSSWVLLASGLGFLATVTSYVVKQRLEHQQLREAEERERSKRDQELRLLVALWPPPLVSEVDVGTACFVLGITPSEIARRYAHPGHLPPYVQRDVDARLDEALRTASFVLLTGHSKAGKSRTAFEAIRRALPDRRLLVPTGGAALSRLFSLHPVVDWGPEPAVLWLDDFQRFLGSAGLGELLLNALFHEERRITVVATLTSAWRMKLATQGDIGAQDVQPLLKRFVDTEFHIESRLSTSEFLRAIEHYPHEPEHRLAAGLGEHLVAARELTTRFANARGSLPEGCALVTAAADWRRAGLLRPIPESHLRELAALYLHELRVDAELTEEAYVRGMKWAREPVSSHLALLSSVRKETGRGFTACEYIADHLDREGVPIPEWTWSFLIEHACPEEKNTLGVSADQRGQPRLAERAFESAWDSGHVHAAPWAAIHLGRLLAKRGNGEGARAAYERALGSDHPDAAPRAAVHLGLLLSKLGEIDAARAAYERALRSGHPDATPRATVHLGFLLEGQGDTRGARDAYERALCSGHPDAAPWAALNLGLLLAKSGDAEGARVAHERALRSGHPDAAGWAALSLGALLAERGEIREACAAYRQALGSPHEKVRRMAWQALRKLRSRYGAAVEQATSRPPAALPSCPKSLAHAGSGPLTRVKSRDHPVGIPDVEIVPSEEDTG